MDVLIKKNPGQNREDLDLSQGTPQSFVPQGKDQMRVRLRLTSKFLIRYTSLIWGLEPTTSRATNMCVRHLAANCNRVRRHFTKSLLIKPVFFSGWIPFFNFHILNWVATSCGHIFRADLVCRCWIQKLSFHGKVKRDQFKERPWTRLPGGGGRKGRLGAEDRNPTPANLTSNQLSLNRNFDTI